MPITQQLPISKDELQRLSEFIKREFDVNYEIIAIYRVGTGANADAHVAAKSSTGQYYGLKICVRGVQHGTDKEKKIADLAALLEAPNFCPIRQYEEVQEIGPLKYRRINVIKWLPNAKNLNEVPPEEIKKNSKEFFKQYGEWFCFALIFGVRDRHLGNWVWDSRSKRLSMIDNQDAFIESEPEQLLPNLMINSFSNLNKFKNEHETFEDAVAFREGLKTMFDKVHKKREEIRKILTSMDFSSDYVPKYLDMEFPEFFARILHHL